MKRSAVAIKIVKDGASAVKMPSIFPQDGGNARSHRRRVLRRRSASSLSAGQVPPLPGEPLRSRPERLPHLHMWAAAAASHLRGLQGRLRNIQLPSHLPWRLRAAAQRLSPLRMQAAPNRQAWGRFRPVPPARRDGRHRSVRGRFPPWRDLGVLERCSSHRGSWGSRRSQRFRGRDPISVERQCCVIIGW